MDVPLEAPAPAATVEARRPPPAPAPRRMEDPDLYGADVDQIYRPPTKRQRAATRRRGELPEPYRQMLGDAHMSFTDGDYKKAYVLLTEIVKKCPTSSQAYLTLGLMHEDLEENEKALGFYVLAAQHDEKDVRLQTQIAKLAARLGQIDKAIPALNVALKYNPDELECRQLRAELLIDSGDSNGAMRDLMHCHKMAPSIEVHKEIAKLHWKQSNHLMAAQHLKEASEMPGGSHDNDLINMLCEVQLSLRNYDTVIRIISRALGEQQDEHSMLIDLIVKYGIAQLHLGNTDAAQRAFDQFQEEPQSELSYPDLYEAVADAYMEKKDYQRALHALERLATNPVHNTATVWAKQGDCYRLLDEPKKAIERYRRVLDEDPSFVQASVHMAELLYRQGKHNMALALLEDADDSDAPRTVTLSPTDLQILAQKCRMLFEVRNYDFFLRKALPLVHMYVLHVMQALAVRKISARFARLPEVKLKLQMVNDADPVQLVDKQVAYQVVHDVCRALAVERTPEAYERALVYLQITSASPVFEHVDQAILQLKSMECGIGHLHCDFRVAFDAVCWICKREPDRIIYWKQFLDIVWRSRDYSAAVRFISRAISKRPRHVPMRFVRGHLLLMSGDGPGAYRDYLWVFGQYPKDATAALCTGVALLTTLDDPSHLARASEAMHAFSMIDAYKRLAGDTAECAYNVARAYHQVGIVHIATMYYRRALDKAPPTPIRHAASINLAQIYAAAGSTTEDLGGIVENLTVEL